MTFPCGVANPATAATEPPVARSDGAWTETSTRPDGAFTVTTYQNWLVLKTETFPAGADENTDPVSYVTYGHDSLRRRTTATHSRTGLVTTHYHTGSGTVSHITDHTRVTTYAYDIMGRTTTVNAPATGGHANISYTSHYKTGALKARWGGQTYPTWHQYDSQGRIILLKTHRTAPAAEPDGTTGDPTTWAYTPAGRLLSKTDAQNHSVSYTRTNAGRTATRTNARDILTTYHHDPAGRLLAIDYPNTGTAATPDILYARDRLGRLQTASQGVLAIPGGGTPTMATPIRSVSFAFDPATFLPLSETHDFGTFSKTITRTYEDGTDDTVNLRPNGFTFPDGSATWTYAASGRLETVTNGTDTWTYGYQPGSHSLIQTVTGPAVTVANTWETTRDVLDTRTNTVTIGSSAGPVSSFDYAVNAIGQRESVAPVLDGQNNPVSTHYLKWTWNYNARGELVVANDTTAANNDRAYQFDAVGNRIVSTETSGQTSITTSYYGDTGQDPPAGANALNQYKRIVRPGSAIDPVHDFDGNMTSGPVPGPAGTAPGSLVAALEWDAENRLVKATAGPDVVAYAYDSMGRRIKRTVTPVGQTTPVSATWNLHDGWNRIAEYTGAANPVLSKTYTWGLDLSNTLQSAGGVGGLLSVLDAASGASHYPTYDGNGNVSEYIDQTGAKAAHFEYGPFGSLTVGSPAAAAAFPYRFSTKPQDPSTGLYHYGYRDLNIMTGRWTAKDTIGERGGVNLYGFVGNDGMNHQDYHGLRDNQILPHGAHGASRPSMTCEKAANELSGLAVEWRNEGLVFAADLLEHYLDNTREEFNPLKKHATEILVHGAQTICDEIASHACAEWPIVSVDNTATIEFDAKNEESSNIRWWPFGNDDWHLFYAYGGARMKVNGVVRYHEDRFSNLWWSGKFSVTIRDKYEFIKPNWDEKGKQWFSTRFRFYRLALFLQENCKYKTFEHRVIFVVGCHGCCPLPEERQE